MSESLNLKNIEIKKVNISIDLAYNAQEVDISPKENNKGIKDSQDLKPLLIFVPLILVLAVFLSMNHDFLKIGFGAFALFSSFIYGYYAFEIHNIDKSQIIKSNWYRYNQYWFNGLGAFIGWIALYILLFYKLKITNSPLCFTSFANNLGWDDLVLFLVSYFGITGHLPLASLLNGLKK